MLDTTDWWPEIPLERWRCTAAMARMHGLMGGLDKLCKIFKINQYDAKDARRSRIGSNCFANRIRRKILRHFTIVIPIRWSGTNFSLYGGSDVTAMRAVWRQLPKWNATPYMWRKWHLDQRMNDRGVAVDLKLAQGAVDATTKAKQMLKDTTSDLTLGEVEAQPKSRSFAPIAPSSESIWPI